MNWGSPSFLLLLFVVGALAVVVALGGVLGPLGVVLATGVFPSRVLFAAAGALVLLALLPIALLKRATATPPTKRAGSTPGSARHATI